MWVTDARTGRCVVQVTGPDDADGEQRRRSLNPRGASLQRVQAAFGLDGQGSTSAGCDARAGLASDQVVTLANFRAANKLRVFSASPLLHQVAAENQRIAPVEHHHTTAHLHVFTDAARLLRSGLPVWHHHRQRPGEGCNSAFEGHRWAVNRCHGGESVLGCGSRRKAPTIALRKSTWRLAIHHVCDSLRTDWFSRYMFGVGDRNGCDV